MALVKITRLTDPSHVQTYIHVTSDGPMTHIHGRTVAAVSKQAKWNVSDISLYSNTADTHVHHSVACSIMSDESLWSLLTTTPPTPPCDSPFQRPFPHESKLAGSLSFLPLSVPEQNLWDKWNGLFISRMPLLSPSQQCQRTEGKSRQWL